MQTPIHKAMRETTEGGALRHQACCAADPGNVPSNKWGFALIPLSRSDGHDVLQVSGEQGSRPSILRVALMPKHVLAATRS